MHDSTRMLQIILQMFFMEIPCEWAGLRAYSSSEKRVICVSPPSRQLRLSGLLLALLAPVLKLKLASLVNMSKSQSLRALVSERLTAAAEDIFALVERTIAEYEEELCRCKEENQRKQEILEELLKQVQHTSGDSQKLFLHSPSVPDPELLQCKEEAPELSFSLQTSVKSPDGDDDDDDEDWEEPAASTSTAQMETEADGDKDEQVQMKDTRTAANKSTHFSKYNSGVPQFKHGPSSGPSPTLSHRHSPGCAECEKHECPFCGKKFSTKQNLKNHTRIHTGEKPFSCTVCHESFTAKGHLKDHMRVHTGEKPYRCSVCDRAFARQFTLQGHMRTHTGERPYSCAQCGATFVQRSHLTKHMSTHHGEERAQCVICQRRFTTRALMVQHMTEEHSGQEQALTRALLDQQASEEQSEEEQVWMT